MKTTPETLSYTAVLKKLNLHEMPEQHAFSVINEFMKKPNGLKIYAPIKTAAVIETDVIEYVLRDNDDGGVDMLAGGTTLVGLDQTILLNDIHFVDDYVSTCRVSDDKHTYQIVEEENPIFVRFAYIPKKLIYFDKDEVETFIKNNQGKKSTSRLNGTEKSLALLCRELSETAPKFKSGNSVNASELKNHILSLAKKYNVTDGLLKSMDDTINKVLDRLDLKELK